VLAGGAQAGRGPDLLSRQNGVKYPGPVQFFRSTLLPAAIVLLFGLALFAVSARIWLPGDMAAPAPIN
jgi:hypothetical protein